eukprot:TRINITY_DN30440_c0_g2_i1.p2 TRINITY_DN30440_c0_g2~~TRINITY_DN30440_c0_g2_i1.p2  ORF type:complete len:168 (-),score=20.24 TRINITY_DN30440_c0_g2_i1:397-900(-)
MFLASQCSPTLVLPTRLVTSQATHLQSERVPVLASVARVRADAAVMETPRRILERALEPSLCCLEANICTPDLASQRRSLSAGLVCLRLSSTQTKAPLAACGPGGVLHFSCMALIRASCFGPCRRLRAQITAHHCLESLDQIRSIASLRDWRYCSSGKDGGFALASI